MSEREDEMWRHLERFTFTTADPRPVPISSWCGDLEEGLRFREQITGQTWRKVKEIHDESLGEERLMELNAEINELMQEKLELDRRIIEIGGPDHLTHSTLLDVELETNTVITRYFGAARKLPAVMEIIKNSPKSQPIRRPWYCPMYI